MRKYRQWAFLLKLIRIIFIYTFIFSGYTVLAQSKKEKIQSSKIDRQFAIVKYLYQLNQSCWNIYSGSLSTVYRQIDFEEKAKLREVIVFTVPQLKKQSSSYSEHHELKLGLDSAFSEIDKLSNYSITNTSRLVRFEDYENDANLSASKKLFIDSIKPFYAILDKQLHRIIREERKELNALIKEVASNHKPRKTSHFSVPDEIERNYNALIAFYEVESKIRIVISGALSWVYVPSDTDSKEEFAEMMKKEYPLMIQNIESLAKDERNPIQRIQIDSLVSLFRHYQKSFNYYDSALVNKEDYNNPLKVLLAEDHLESLLLPIYDLTTSLLAILKSEYTDRVGVYIYGESTKKKQAIKKMLEYQYIHIQPLIDQQLKAIKDGHIAQMFKMEELFDELVFLYEERFTYDEIKQILKFQQSRVGEKLNVLSSQLLVETSLITNAYFKKLINRYEVIHYRK